MLVSAKRMAVLREHIRAESEHDMDALLGGMTPDCFNDVVGVPKPFVGPEQTAERYRKHWEGFPDFTVQVRRVLCADASWVATENEWRGTHLGTFLGWPPTGKPVKVRAVVVWHFKGDDLWGETIFFDNASILKQIGAEIDIPPPSGLPVFWTCRKDHLAQLHFDIRQYNCIDWMDEPDLAKRLQRRIEAVIGRGPVKQTDAG